VTQWACEREFEITVEGMPAIVPVRFVVEAASREEAALLAEAASEAAFRAAAGDDFPGNPAGPVVVLDGR
jgi:hypothetical protein